MCVWMYMTSALFKCRSDNHERQESAGGGWDWMYMKVHYLSAGQTTMEGRRAPGGGCI